MSRLINVLPLAALCIAGCAGGEDGDVSMGRDGTRTSDTAIAAIQGPGRTSPLAGRDVTVTGIVTGDFQDDDADVLHDLGGFFLQSERPDADPGTSDGVFVFEGGGPQVDVSEGDKVSVSGRVQEYFGETQIIARRITIRGSGDIAPVDIVLPAPNLTSNSDGDGIADLERYEGMLVRFPQTLTVTDLNALERYGAIRLSEGGRLYQFTNRNAPNAPLYRAHRQSNAARTITLDDGRRASYARPPPYHDRAGEGRSALRVGDTVSGVTGNLRYSRGSAADGIETWRLMPTVRPAFDDANPRPGAPRIAGELKVAAFNVFNYFSSVDGGGTGCGPAADSRCRGADSALERERQLDKIVAALAMIDADITGLIELENNAGDSLTDIVAALNALSGPGTYTFLDTGTVGRDAIKNGFLFKPSTVSPIGALAVLDSRVDPRFNDARNRPALAQAFVSNTTGGRFSIVLNHLKSKGSDCASDGDPNTGDGQGNCNRTRTRAARALVDWIAGDPTASGDPDYLLVGDLNAYIEEDPLRVFAEAEFVNLVEADPPGTAYSFVFDGQAGALDYALASAELAPQVRAGIAWHINADEARIHDYNLENARDPGIFDGSSPFRSSDHDPVIVGIDLN